MSTTDWDDAERVDPEELDNVPPGTADEMSEAGLGMGTTGTDVGGGTEGTTEEPGEWTEGGGTLGPEGEGTDAGTEPPRREEDTL